MLFSWSARLLSNRLPARSAASARLLVSTLTVLMSAFAALRERGRNGAQHQREPEKNTENSFHIKSWSFR